jgi:catechol 2,3-dioxygenase-like lactoylglutathione lyase family enzyme
MTLETVVVPVTDVERAKRFYSEQCGFAVDADVERPIRVVQLTPPGSGCSISIGPLVVEQMPVPAAQLQLCVTDIDAAREELAGRGVEISDVVHFGPTGREPGPGGPFNTFCFFNDPDGNGWAVQEVPLDRSSGPG